MSLKICQKTTYIINKKLTITNKKSITFFFFFFLQSKMTIYYHSADKLFRHCTFGAQVPHVNCIRRPGKINIKLLCVRSNIQWVIFYIGQRIALHALLHACNLYVTSLVFQSSFPWCLGPMRIVIHLYIY